MSIKQKIRRILKSLILLCKEREIVPIPTPIDTQRLLDGKVALITGGSSGIGLSMAESFAKSGCKVIIAGRHEETLKKYSSDINHKIGCESVKYIILDVLDVQSMAAKIRAAAEIFEKNR